MIEVVESAAVDRRRVVHEELLDLQPIRYLRQIKHVTDSTPIVVLGPAEIGSVAMVRLISAVAASFSLVFAGSVPVALADQNMQPPGSVPIPDGPAAAWIIADMDSGQILAGRDMYAAHPPASTIKTLLALTALDELSLDATVVADEADARVECNCAGIKPGQTYTTRQLLDAVLLVSGNDAANTLADLLGGFDTAVDKMNAKAASIGAVDTHAATPSGLDGAGGSGWTLRTTLRSSSGRLWPIRCSRRSPPSRWLCSRPRPVRSRSSTRTSCWFATPVRSAARRVSPTPPVRLSSGRPIAMAAAW